MGRQSYGDESNWKHEPNTPHHVDDSFGKDNATRNWEKKPSEDKSKTEKNKGLDVAQDDKDSETKET